MLRPLDQPGKGPAELRYRLELLRASLELPDELLELLDELLEPRSGDEPLMPPLFLSELLDEPLIPLPRLRSGLLDDPPTLPRFLSELLDDELLEDDALIPLRELEPSMSSVRVDELPMPSPLRRSERPLPPVVLPVLPTLDRSLLRVLPTLLVPDAPKPLSLLLLEPLFDLDELLFNPLRSELLEDEPLAFWSELSLDRSPMLSLLRHRVITPAPASPIPRWQGNDMEIARQVPRARPGGLFACRIPRPRGFHATLTAVTLWRMRLPPLLGPGARVALVAPSGPLHGKDDLTKALESVRRMGWEPVVGEHVLDRDAYLAGCDTDRVADLNHAAASPDVDGIWCVRGGYGAMRILPLVDYGAWRDRPKALIGYSDITALHAAIGRRADLVTFHGPTAREQALPFSVDSMRRVLVCGQDPCGTAADAVTLVPGRATGRLVGGNLALLAALTGTPYAPDYSGGILVIEDVNESVYRIDRLLAQLHLSGALAGIAGLAFGSFSDVPAEVNDDAEGVDRVIREFAVALGKPCLAGIPMGHAGAQWTLPLGLDAELDADSHSLTVHL